MKPKRQKAARDGEAQHSATAGDLHIGPRKRSRRSLLVTMDEMALK